MEAVKLILAGDEIMDNASMLLANFTHGTLMKDKSQALTFNLHCKQENGKKSKIMVAESDRMRYLGYNFGGGDTRLPEPSYTYMIGVHEQGQSKITLIPVDLFTFRPSFPDDFDQRDEVAINLPQDRDMSYKEKSDRLTSMFGTNKRKRIINSRLRSCVEADVVQSVMGKAAEEVEDKGILEMISRESEDNEFQIIPRCNKEATTPTEVYSLDDIISEREMAALDLVVDIFTEAKGEQMAQWAADKTYCRFILLQLQCLPMEPSSRKHKAKLLLYLHYMLSIFLMKTYEIRKKGAFPDSWPSVCVKSLKSNFMMVDASGTLTISLRQRDKLAAHLLVLCLILNEFELPLKEIAQTLKFSKQKITLMMKMLGCSIHNQRDVGGKSNVACLKIPLVFPEPRVHNKKRRQ